ncbi:MAG: chemotaxis protein CheA [Firmicutes bacterium]|nr:chemotaxis protein CheA [Bacillota bacterium]
MDNKAYLPIFLDETRENIQLISENLLTLEENPANRDALDELFRATHTIKGMSATMGYEGISLLAHEMENYLDMVRNDEVTLSSSVINAFFEIVDEIEANIRSLEENGTCKGTNHTLINSIATLLKEHCQPEPDDTGANNKIEIRLELSDDCALKAARLLTVYNRLDGIGNIVTSEPGYEDLVASRADKYFTCILDTNASQEQLEAVLDNCMDLQDYSIVPLKPVEQENPEPAPDTLTRAKSHHTIRIDTDKMDHLLNLVSELVINKTSIQQAAAQAPEMTDNVEHLHRLTSDLQAIVMKMRMIPIETVFNRFPRMVRDCSRSLAKSVQLQIFGGETELDRTIIEDIADPLVHLIRNAIDHGIESEEERKAAGKTPQGTIVLRAFQTGNQVIIEVSDDGRGLDLERIRQKLREQNLALPADIGEWELMNSIFMPGFSTSSAVTDISGRGVGLDVAKKSIEAMGGTIQVASEHGLGTNFTIRLPLTLAIIQGLLVQSGPEIYVVPLSFVRETEIIYREDIQKVGSQDIVMLRGKVLPVVNLCDLMQVPDAVPGEELNLVIVRQGNRELGLIVDDLLGQQEIVIKTINWGDVYFKTFLGATILGDGSVVLIIDVNTLLVPFKDKEDGKVGESIRNI